MKQKILFCVVSFFIGSHLPAMNQPLPPLIKGSIYLHNTLDEKIAYQMKATITGSDSALSYSFKNNTVRSTGEIPAQSTIKLFSGIVIDNQDIWGGPVELTLQPESMAKPTGIALIEDIIGLYYIAKKKITEGTHTSEYLTITKGIENGNEDDAKTNDQAPNTSGASN